MLNKIILMGRLTRDPELRHTQTGLPVASFSLAVDHDFKDKNTGDRGVDFINIVAWRGTAEFVKRYFAKGRMAVVEGRLQMRDYTDKNGNKRTAAEVVAENVYFGDSKPAGERGGDTNYSNAYAAAPQESPAYPTAQSTTPYDSSPSTNEGYAPISDDGELPF
ncbi:MAG: single-stranded DNA-binding protein [Eubacteriales bacterium]